MKNNYNVWYPYESFNMGQRFFFFNELLNHTDTDNSANGKSGADLATEVSNALKKELPSIDPSSAAGLEKIQEVLQFLQQTIEYERGQEIAYYEKYFLSADLPRGLKDRFQKLFNSTGAFDYIEFINLINILHDGVDKYKTILNYEVNRLEQLQEVIDEYLENPEEHYTITKEGESEDKGFYSNFNSFLWRKSKQTGLIKYRSAQGTSTISNALQKQMIAAVTNLWKTTQWQKQASSMLEQLVFNEPINENTMRIFSTMLLNETLPKIQDAVIQFLNIKKFTTDTNYSNVLIDANKLKDIIRVTAQEYVDKLNAGTDPAAAVRFINTLKSQIGSDNQIQLNNDSKRYLSVIDPVGIKKKNQEEIVTISDEVMKILQSLIKEKQQTPATTKKEIIEQFVQLYGDPKLVELQEGSFRAKDAYNLIKSYIPTMESVIEFHIAAKDNLVSEALAGGNRKYLQEVAGSLVLEKFETAGGYQKADTFGIVNEQIGEIFVSLDRGALQNYFSDISEQITKSYIDAIEIQFKPIKVGSEIFDEQSFRQKKGFRAKEFSIEAETERRLIFLKKRCIELRKSLEEEKVDNEKIEAAVQSLKSTIQISSTVKSYNKYNNKDGFHGGSLGGSVENQLKNITKMFEYGGITMPDVEWLAFAAYNSGNGMLGEGMKEPLEDALSAVAGMLLFDDAGEQALYIRSQLNDKIPSGSSRFLHLYHLNDFYFPSSYILQLTYNGLLKAYNLLNSELAGFSTKSATHSNSRGARITIVNNVGAPPPKTGWEEYFNANKDSVSVNIVFLAGLLDIIQILNQSMQ